MIKHSVYFYLTDKSNKKLQEDFRNEVTKLTSIPSVVNGYVGVPAPTPKRPQVDDQYDFGLVVYFENMQGHDLYQEHPIHKEFLTKAKSYWNKVQIYDVEF